MSGNDPVNGAPPPLIKPKKPYKKISASALPVMQAIKRRKGLCKVIAKRLRIEVSIVRCWPRVPLKWVQSVSKLTGIPVEVMRAEHKTWPEWKIPLSEVTKIETQVPETSTPAISNLERLKRLAG